MDLAECRRQTTARAVHRGWLSQIEGMKEIRGEEKKGNRQGKSKVIL